MQDHDLKSKTKTRKMFARTNPRPKWLTNLIQFRSWSCCAHHYIKRLKSLVIDNLVTWTSDVTICRPMLNTMFGSFIIRTHPRSCPIIPFSKDQYFSICGKFILNTQKTHSQLSGIYSATQNSLIWSDKMYV